MITAALETKSVFLPTHALKQLIDRVSFAADGASTRFAFGSILFEVVPGQITAVATDGRRLAWAHLECDHYIDSEGFSLLLSGPDCKKLAKSITKTANRRIEVSGLVEHSTNVRFEWSRKSKRFCQDVAVIDGRFPKWRDVTANLATNATWTVTCKLLTERLPEYDRQRCFAFDLNTDKLSAKPNYATVDLTSSRFDRKKCGLTSEWVGHPMQIAFDIDYALEWIETREERENVNIHFQDPDSAIRFEVSDRSCGYVLMPMQCKA